MSGTISSLRDMVPIRPLTFAESYRIAELQASKLREVAGVDGPALPETAISGLPRVQVERMFPAPMAGATQWSHGRWLIVLNGGDPLTRQRFSLAHEFKHVIDNPFIHVLYPTFLGMSSKERAEHVAEYFAACLLIPRVLLKKSWCGGVQNVTTLARQFNVSHQAMRIRLLQIGLIEPQVRCAMNPALMEVPSYDENPVPAP